MAVSGTAGRRRCSAGRHSVAIGRPVFVRPRQKGSHDLRDAKQMAVTMALTGTTRVADVKRQLLFNSR
jgi:isopentenyl diphosphate isomerase/L-lactate dehydrogenase-like FMN-dependent dehydrogenase